MTSRAQYTLSWQDLDVESMTEYWDWQQQPENWDILPLSSETCNVCSQSTNETIFRCRHCGWKISTTCRSRRRGPTSLKRNYDLHHAGCKRPYSSDWFEELQRSASGSNESITSSSSSSSLSEWCRMTNNGPMTGAISNEMLGPHSQQSGIVPGQHAKRPAVPNLRPVVTDHLDGSAAYNTRPCSAKSTYYVEVLDNTPVFRIRIRLPGFSMQPYNPHGYNAADFTQPDLVHVVEPERISISDRSVLDSSPVFSMHQMFGSGAIFEPPTCSQALDADNGEFSITKTTVLQITCMTGYRVEIHADTIIFYRRAQPADDAFTANQDKEVIVAIIDGRRRRSAAKQKLFQQMVHVDERTSMAPTTAENRAKRARIDDAFDTAASQARTGAGPVASSTSRMNRLLPRPNGMNGF